MIRKFQLKKFLEEKQLLKVIAGMENFDEHNIKMVVNAASLGGAHAVDISADADNIQWVKENHTRLITFVSSMSTVMLAQAHKWGADVLELGNYDSHYERGQVVTKEEVIEKTRELRSMVGSKAVICITVPGNVSIEEQVDLSVQLQAAGADILQVENLVSESDYANAKAISEAVEIPVLLSGRINSSKVEKAMATGVNAVGIGAAINKQTEINVMVDEVKAAMKAIRASKVSA